jgi:hypothetical protein
MLEGFETIDEHAATCRRSRRTLERWVTEPDGLPHTRLGRQLLFKVEWTTAWLESRRQQRNPVKLQPHRRAKQRRAALSCASA